MKKHLLLISIAIISCVSCQENINYVDSLKGYPILFDSINTGEMLINDSLILFASSKYPSYLLSLFNLKNGKHIDNFIQKGTGPNDFLGINMMNVIFEEKGAAYIWIYAYNEQKVIEFNLDKASASQPPLDSIFSFPWSDQHLAPFNYIFRLDTSSTLIKTPLESLYEDGNDLSLPKYQIIDTKSRNIKREYKIYNQTITNKTNKIYSPSIYYLTTDQIKPDLSKVVISMGLLAQINILDLESGKLTGYRLKDTPDFSYLTKDVDMFNIYYKSTTASNKYIYSLFVNKPFTPQKGIASSNEIHVFDWNGNFIQKLILDHNIDKIRLDVQNNILYGKDDTTDTLYRFNIKELS